MLVEPAPVPPCCRYFAGEFTDSSLHSSLSHPRKSHRHLHNHEFTGAPQWDRLWLSCKCGRAVCLPPFYIAWCDPGSPHFATIFRRSPGSAAVTTLGQILQCSVWTSKKSGNLPCLKANPALQCPANSNH